MHFPAKSPRKTRPSKMSLTAFWEFCVDKGYHCVFKKEGKRYRLYFIGTHDLIEKWLDPFTCGARRGTPDARGYERVKKLSMFLVPVCRLEPPHLCPSSIRTVPRKLRADAFT
jgi:hypothetical protein